MAKSSSPLANLLLEELARRYDLPRLVPLTEYGKWRQAYPEIGCGLKRGFSFYAHEAGRAFIPREDRQNELLVAASPCDAVADTHWLRAEFDQFLVQEAQSLGVEYADRVALEGVRWAPGGEAELFGAQAGRAFSARARYVVDATGPRGFLARALGLAEVPFETLPPTQALFTHFAGVRRWASLHPPHGAPPYPPDAAALHHVFDGGWISGAALRQRGDERRHRRDRLAGGGAAVRRRRAGLGAAAGALSLDPRAVHGGGAGPPFIHAPRLPYRCARWAGPGWTLLPSAGAFVDPLFSTGIPLTLLGIERLGRAFEEAWGTPELDSLMAEGAALSAREAAAAARLVGASYAGFRQFPLLAAISMFYFAAASHSEMARRLGGQAQCVVRIPYVAESKTDPSLSDTEYALRNTNHA